MKEYQNGALLLALARAIQLTVPANLIKDDPEQTAQELHLMKPATPEYKAKNGVDFIPTKMGLSLFDDVSNILSRASMVAGIVDMFKDAGVDLTKLKPEALVPDPPVPQTVQAQTSGVHPGFGRHNIGGEVIDFDQVVNMNRVVRNEAEDKRQENLAARGAAAEQRMAREEIYSKAQERAKEIAAEMRKGLKDNGE